MPESIIPTVLFYTFSCVMIFAAIMVVSSKNPVHSVLFLILSFFNSAGLFVLLGAEFIAMLMVIVYVGAVAVLFLFVVMMLNVDFAQMRGGFAKNLPIGITVSVILLAELVMIIRLSLNKNALKADISSPILENINNTESLGQIIYTQYVYAFQISGLVLLVAMIGAITLTLRTREGVKKQKVDKQIDRDRSKSMEIVKVESGKGI